MRQDDINVTYMSRLHTVMQVNAKNWKQLFKDASAGLDLYEGWDEDTLSIKHSW